MINTKELKIGNWFKWNELASMGKDFDCIRTGKDIDAYSALKEPISLLPEVLEKAGFEQLPHFTIQNSWFKKLGRDRVLSIACVGTPNEMVFVCEEVPPEVKNIIVVRNYDYEGKTYLHHIQNIYSDFTNGKELEIKL